MTRDEFKEAIAPLMTSCKADDSMLFVYYLKGNERFIQAENLTAPCTLELIEKLTSEANKAIRAKLMINPNAGI